MIIKSFKKSVIAWDDYERSFYQLNNESFFKPCNLLHILKQKEILYENTVLFAKGLLSNNVLLWGSRGTGKSSLIHTVFNEIIKDHNISLLELRKNQVKYLSTILRKISDPKQKFIIFCDDFSFSTENEDFILFKNILDGTVSKNNNLIYYVTSNFRNILKNNSKDNKVSMLEKNELVDDETALSDRFGIWLGFSKFSETQYLDIIKSYCKHYNINIDAVLLKKKAIQWSLNRGSRSGREAHYFVKSLINNKM
tara:strand:- start:1050 stop:1808 length:759 start_codon:yes stop_codon:yes gene_type:complete